MALTQVQPGMLGATQPYNFKNRIINGAMVIDQRNAGASVTVSGGEFVVDRWKCRATSGSKYSAQQNAGSVTPPVGFVNYLGTTSLSAYSVTSSDYFVLVQNIEGYNVADLGWGTASAKTVTLSFQVYSSLTGTFGGSILNNNNNRSYPFTYTVSSANTWTPISITIAGDTTGTWETTTSTGIKVGFGLGAGSTVSGTAGTWSGTLYRSATGATSVVGTNGATFYITGVQLEVGSSATGFEYRQYQQELALCQRYFYQGIIGLVGYVNFSNGLYYDGLNGNLPVQMRAAPTATLASNISANVSSANVTINAITGQENSTLGVTLYGTFSAAQTVGRVVSVRGSGGGSVAFSAEL